MLASQLFITQQKISKIFHIIERREMDFAWIAFTILFLQQLANQLFIVPITGLLLEDMEASSIPIILIIVYANNALVTWSIIKFGGILSLRGVLVLTQIIFCFVLLILGWGTFLIQDRWVYVVGFIASQTSFLLPRIVFWPYLVSKLEVYQIKRLSGFISSGESLGAIVSAILIPVLLGLMDSVYVPFLASILLLFQLPLYGYLFKPEKSCAASKSNTHPKKEIRSKIPLRTFWNTRLLIFISGSMICFSLTYVLIEFQFYSVIQERFTLTQKTSFLGIFFAFSRVFKGGVELLLTGHLLNKLGTVCTHLVQPVVLGVVVAITLISSYFFPLSFFWIIIILMGLDRALSTLFYSSTNVMYHVLDMETRDVVQPYVNGIVASIGAISSYVLLMGLTSERSPVTLSQLNFGVALSCIVWIGFGLSLKKEESRELSRKNSS